MEENNESEKINFESLGGRKNKLKIILLLAGIIFLSSLIVFFVQARGIKLASQISILAGQFFNSGDFKQVGSFSIGVKDNSALIGNDKKIISKNLKTKQVSLKQNKIKDKKEISNVLDQPNFKLKSNLVSVGSVKTDSDKYFSLAIFKNGDGKGRVISDLEGIDCGAYCGSKYKVGTRVFLRALPDGNSDFVGWSGACSGSNDCFVDLNGDIFVLADFKLVNNISGNEQGQPVSQVIQKESKIDKNSPVSIASSPIQTNNIVNNIQNNNSVQDTTHQIFVNPQNQFADHLLVSEILAGVDGNANFEFIELYNPTKDKIDLTGWVIKKKTSSGSELSLVASSRLENKIIEPGRYFLLANEGGYKGSVVSDVSWATSNTLAYTSNSIVIYDKNGQKIDEVGWTEISKGKSFERVSWSGSQFKIEDIPNPQNSQGN